MKKNIVCVIAVGITLFLTGCDSKNTTKTELIEKAIQIPIVTSDPLEELDLSLYKNDGYTLLGSYTWMENKTPAGITVLCKEGESDTGGRSKLYAIAFQYSPDNDTGKQWKIITETRFEEQNSWSEPIEDVVFLKLGKSNFGFATLSKSSTQGYYGEGISIYALVNSNFSKIGGFNTLSLEGNEEDERHLDDKRNLVDFYGVKLSEQTAEIFMEQNTSKSFYDIKVKNKIFQPRKINNPIPIKEWEETHVFKNGKYVSTKQ